MKSLFKLLVLAGMVAVAVVILTQSQRKRATTYPSRPATSWQPPVVVEGEPEPVDVAVAEDEGMTPPAEAPDEDVPLSSSGEPIVSELAPPGAEPAAASPAMDEDEFALRIASYEGMTRPLDDPATDTAISASGELVVSELAAPGAEAELAGPAEALDAEEVALEVASDEGMTPSADEPAGDAAFGSDGSLLVSELAAPDAVESAVLDAESALLDALEASEAAEAASSVAAEETPSETVAEAEPDFLTKYFDELAATSDEAAEAPAADLPPPTPFPIRPPEAARDDDLFRSVEEALTDLEPAPIVPPPRRTAESYLDEGNVYFNVGQYGLAIERYGQAVELDAELTAAYYNRANAHTRAGEFEKALSDYDRALRLQPQDADALNNRGMLHLYRSSYSNALDDFNKALSIDPSDTTVMVNRGLAHLHAGNGAAALSDFREATQQDPNDAAAQYGAAQASAAMGNRDEALRHVGRALEIDPGYAREAAADPRLAILAGDDEFMSLLRRSGTRSGP